MRKISHGFNSGDLAGHPISHLKEFKCPENISLNTSVLHGTSGSAGCCPHPCDFFLWGHQKSKVYVNRPQINIAQLKDSILQEAAANPPEISRRVIDNFRNRLRKCIESNGRKLTDLIFKTHQIKCYYMQIQNKTIILRLLFSFSPYSTLKCVRSFCLTLYLIKNFLILCQQFQ